MIGKTIAHFEVVDKLGEGGMGAVYKARDRHLDRFVALKVLLPEMVTHPDRRRRFVQEAKAASALNHPNIIHIYDIDEAEGVLFIAMEYVAGKTLDQWIGRKPQPLHEVLRYAIQIADALAAAHAAGIVHRDLKPSNIMLNDQGLVKVLDFGLAKLAEPSLDESEATRTVHIDAAPQTDEGTVLGTVAYMSPEQSEGRKLDPRSDIFSFGAVLYEMVTGRRAFSGASRMATLSAILRDDPKPASQVAGNLPPDMEKILARCLRKDPTRRFQHMADLKVALEEVKEESESGKLPLLAASPKPRRPWRLLLIAAASAIAAGLGVALWLARPSRAAIPRSPVQLTFDSGLTTAPALSPDGKLLAFASDRAGKGDLDLWIRQLPAGDAVALTHHPADDYDPDFSPDGSRIAFRSDRDGGGIYVIPALGGIEKRIADAGRQPRFSPDGNWIAYSVGEGSPGAGSYGVHVVPSAGGPSRRLASDLDYVRSAVWTPDGRHLLVSGRNQSASDWWVIPVEGGQAVKTEVSGALRRAGMGSSYLVPGAWPAGGNLVLFSGRVDSAANIWQIPISTRTWQVAGIPQRLTSGTATESAPTISAAGALAFAATNSTSAIWSLPVNGNRAKVTGDIRVVTQTAALNYSPALSADGGKMVFASNRGGHLDVWMKDLAGGAETAITSSPGDKTNPKLSPDGSKVAYNLGAKVYLASTNRGGEEMISEHCGSLLDWSPDGQYLLCLDSRPQLYTALLNVSSRSNKVLLRHSHDGISHAGFSPDMRWIAFTRRKGPNVTSVMVSALHGETAAPENEWITVSGVETWHDKVEWSPDGNLLYFTSDRDGFRCIWAQALDPVTKTPAGPSIPVAHFHEARRSLGNAPLSRMELCVTPDRLIFNLGERTGNIWMSTPQK